MSKKYINLEHTIRIIAEKKMQKESGKDSSDKAQDFIRTFVPSALGLGVVSPEERNAMTDAALKSVEKRLPAAAREQFKKPEIKQELEKIPEKVANQQELENIAKKNAAQTPAGKAGEIAAIATGVAGLARGGLQVAKRVLGNRSKKPSSLKKGAGAAAGAAALDALSGGDGPTRGRTGVDATHGHRPTTGTSDTSAKRKSKLKEAIGFGSDKYEGVPSVFTKPIPTIGPDHERTSEKNSSERKRNKQLNSKTLHSDVSEENEDRKKIKNVARPDSDNPKSYKSELGRQGQIKTKIIDESLTKNIFVSIIKESVLSAYSPQTSNRNRNKKMEGGISSSRPGLGDDPKNWKTWKVRTLDQYNPDDPASYVTVAGHPTHYGKKKTINNISYTTPSGETKELTNVRAYVHDTGRAFKNKAAKKGERFDVAIGKDMPGSLGTQPFSMKKHDIRMGWDEPQEKKPEPPAKQDEPVTPSVSSVSKPEKRASLNALSRNIAAEKNKDNEEQQRKKDREEHDKMWAGSTNAPKEYESGGKRKNNKNPLVVLNPPLKHDIQEQSPQRRPGFSGQMQRNLRAGPAGTIATTPEEERQQYKDVIRTIVPGVDAYQKYKEGDVTGAATSAGLDVLSLGTGGAAIKGAITLGKRYLPKLSPKVSAITGKAGHTGATIGAKEVTGGTSATPPTTTVPQPKPPTPTAPTPTAVAAGVGTGVAATTIPSSTAQPKPTEEVPISSPSPAQSAAAAAGREMPTPAKTEPKAPTSSVTPSAAPSSTPSAAPQKPSAPTNIPKPSPAPTKSSGELPDWKQSLERTGGFSFEDGGKKKRKMSESIVLNYIQNNKKINK